VSDFYIYAYYKPDVDPEYGPPFYVGKGSGERAYVHLARCQESLPRSGGCRFFYATLRKMLVAGVQPEIEIVMDHLLEEEAFAFEKQLIRCIGRRDLRRGPLCNLTDGGEGRSGFVVAEETRRKIGAAHRGKMVSVDIRAKISAGKRGSRHTSETRQRMSQSQIGRKHSAATKLRLRDKKRHLFTPVRAFDLFGVCVHQFDSINAVRTAGHQPAHVVACLRGRRKTHHGLTWEYANA